MTSLILEYAQYEPEPDSDDDEDSDDDSDSDDRRLREDGDSDYGYEEVPTSGKRRSLGDSGQNSEKRQRVDEEVCRLV